MEHDKKEGQEPRMRAGNRNQWVRMLATKPEDLNSIPESLVVEGELTHKLSFALRMGTVTHLLTHIHTIKVKTKRTKSGKDEALTKQHLKPPGRSGG